MSNTLLRAARSAVINSARDFSCAICTADNQLLSSAEGLPAHIFGSHLQTQAMCDLHPDLAEGDAFLHNDVYLGNTHPADHTFLAPVFFEGEHVFTVCAKAHQADVGNSIPSTYYPAARDVYEEGSLIFPCVRIQRNYDMIDDIVRMCRARIRVPDQWYGDFLAGIGAIRIGERRLKELCAKYGKEQIKDFIAAWFDYSEQRMIKAIRKLPGGRFVNEGAHDPLNPMLPDGVPIRVELSVDPENAIVEADLRNNIDCVDCGLNESEACTQNNVLTGIFNCLDPDIPHNAGSFRRIRLLLREGCVVGIPKFPHSCSAATTNVGERLVSITQAAFAKLGEGWGLAEGGSSLGVGYSVISGRDRRFNDRLYINQLVMGNNGGPAGPHADGWVTYGSPVLAGLMYRDSIEIDELKHPVQFKTVRLAAGSGGAGRQRGAPGVELIFGTKHNPMTVAIAGDGQRYPPKGVHGGHDGARAGYFKIGSDGEHTELPNGVRVLIEPGEWIRGVDNGGGGYGNPLDRYPQRVLDDVLERWETPERARDVYGVVLTGSAEDGDLAVDLSATRQLRQQLAQGTLARAEGAAVRANPNLGDKL
ncbi:MAG: hydantoinase B/oxoprolinase family protein [Nitrospiraceae bacterium]|nr:hydantoinase B/oxoprolinase family protein [Nitrospiraceae bacterium]